MNSPDGPAGRQRHPGPDGSAAAMHVLSRAQTATPRPPLVAGDYVLYGFAVSIWGISWIAIKFQVGVVPVELSVAYRFAAAALVMLAWAALSGRRLRYRAADHAWFALSGILMFSSNFALFYYASQYMVSGLMALVFSFASIFNILNAAIFLKDRPSAKAVLGALVGVGGLAAIFLPDILAAEGGWGLLTGLGLSLLATLCFSLGNIVSARMQRNDIRVVPASGYGMAYGALFMLGLTLATGQPFAFDTRPEYLISLIYLILIASVAGFGVYLTLVGRIGAGSAAYATVLFPVVALAISTLFEDYRWTAVSLLGLALVLAGNVIVLRR